MVVVSSPQHNP